jgi:8-oxo-dGTP diphosphatase
MPKKAYNVAAALLFDEQKRILITQRPAGSHLAGFWEFPGGTIEDNESAQDALVREIKEETGLDIKAGKLYWQDCFEYDVKIINISFYFCRRLNEHQKITPLEIADFRWIRLDELQNYKFPPADEALINRLLKNR